MFKINKQINKQIMKVLIMIFKDICLSSFAMPFALSICSPLFLP